MPKKKKKKKMKLTRIADDASRRQTFRKRKRGLMKKAQELSVLCNIPTSLIIYSPYDEEAQVWPRKEEALSTMTRFLSLPMHEQEKNRLDQEMFLRQQIVKLNEQVKREEKRNRELESEFLTSWFFNGGRKRLVELTLNEVNHLQCMVDRKLREVQARMDILFVQQQVRNDNMLSQAPSFLGPSTPASHPQQSCYLNLPPPPPSLLPNHITIEGTVHGVSSSRDNVAARIRALRRQDWSREMMG